MKKGQLYTGLILLLLGWIGVASLLTMNIPLPVEAETILRKRFSSYQIKLLLLINPTIFVFIAVIIGTLLYKKVNLKVSIIESFFDKKLKNNCTHIIKYGALGGLLAGILLGIITIGFKPFLPQEFIELGENLKPSLPARFLYGGLTEEILLRFGFMTFIVWLIYLITKKINSTTYWIGIIIASIIFAMGHFPIIFNSIANPPIILLGYILFGNGIGGLIFGWLYYKKGLESAFIAHFTTHVCLIIGENLFQ